MDQQSKDNEQKNDLINASKSTNYELNGRMTQTKPSRRKNVPTSPILTAASHELKFDLQSIDSLYTFHNTALGLRNPSTGSISLMSDLPQSAQQEVLRVLISDINLRPLLEEAARTENDRFTRNIRPVLMQYSEDLHKSAAGTGEKAVAAILRQSSQCIASGLFDMVKPDRDTSNQRRMNDPLKQDADRRPILESYLAEESLHHALLQGNPAQPKIEEEDESICGESNDNIVEDSRFPKLDHLKRFLTVGQAFENLRKNVLDFVLPERPPMRWTKNDDYARTDPIDKFSGLATSPSDEKPNMQPEIDRFDSTADQYNLTVLRDLLTVGELHAVEELQGKDELPSDRRGLSSDSSENSNDMSLEHSCSPSASDPASGDSIAQEHTALESSYQPSTSTEQTDLSLMEYEVDYSDDDLGSPSLDGSGYIDTKTEERLSNPRTYFRKLESLEQEIYDNLSVWIYKRDSASKAHFRLADDWCRVMPPSGKNDDIQRSIEASNEKLQSLLLMRLLECYNIVQ